MSNKRLSIIIPFYNVEQYIAQCLDSVYNQDVPEAEYEVICVDDCSPDGSHAIVERLQKKYPNLILLTTPENLRQGGARNMGLDVAQYQYDTFDGAGYKRRSWHHLSSWGGDLTFDINLLSSPASATMALTFSVYRPSEGGLFVSFGADLPF